MNQYGVNDDVTKSIDKVQEEVRDYAHYISCIDLSAYIAARRTRILPNLSTTTFQFFCFHLCCYCLIVLHFLVRLQNE